MKSHTSDGGNILAFDRGLDQDLENERHRSEQGRLSEEERMAALGMMAFSLSHDIRNSLSAIYANAEFLGRSDRCAGTQTELLLEIQEAVLRITERIDSLLQFGMNERNNQLIPECMSFIFEKAVAAVKLHPDGRDVCISVGKVPLVEADIDPRHLESAIYNLLLNACQAATRSSQAPEVKVNVMEVDEQIYVTISDNGPGIPAHIRKTLFNPFVTAGKPNGTGLGLTLVRRIVEERGGSVCLVESYPGKTVFTLNLMKNKSLP